MTTTHPSEELTPEQKFRQIMHLLNEGYISLSKARALAMKHCPEPADRYSWVKVNHKVVVRDLGMEHA